MWRTESIIPEPEWIDPKQVHRMREKLKETLDKQGKDTHCGDEELKKAASAYRRGEYVKI